MNGEEQASEECMLVPEDDWLGTEEQAALCSELRDKLGELSLSNDAIWERERARPDVEAPWIIKAPYLVRRCRLNR